MADIASEVTSETPPGEEKRRPGGIPIWLSIPLVLLALAGGWWTVNYFLAMAVPKPETSIFVEPPPSAVQQGRRGDWMIAGPTCQLRVFDRNGQTIFQPAYKSFDFVPREQQDLLKLTRRIVNDSTLSNAMQVTPDQTRQLAGLSSRIFMAIDPQDSERLQPIWKNWQNADLKTRPGIEEQLIAAIEDIGRKNIPRTQALASDRITKIKSILTPEQWAKAK